MSNKEKNKVSLSEMFKEYAKQEIETIKNSDPNKVYHRVLPNLKDKNKGYIDFLYKKIIVGGIIDKNTIYLNKLKITQFGREEDVEKVIKKITQMAKKGDMKIVNQL